MSKIGILGGTFDPIHKGHIYLAQEAKEKCELEKIIFLPLNSPPHKPQPTADPYTRYDLIKRAIANMDGFSVCDMEINRSGTTYTVDTLQKLKQIHPEWDIYYIVGTDTLFYLEKWKNIDVVFSLCTFICMSRPIDNQTRQQEKARYLRDKLGAKIILVKSMGKDVSSTAIKSADEIRLAQLVPAAILHDVRKIYVKDENKINRQQLLNKLQPLISEERYNHTLSTEKTAIELAKLHGANVEKASLAALLHDSAKRISKDPQGFCKKHNLEKHLHDYDDLPLCVLHAPMGAHLAKEKFGVDDPEILSAITWHTSGRPNMSLMDKIIYLADYTEPTRFGTPEIEEVRDLCKTDLDMALYKALKYSIDRIKAKGNPVHITTLNAYNYMKEKMEERNE